MLIKCTCGYECNSTKDIAHDCKNVMLKTISALREENETLRAQLNLTTTTLKAGEAFIGDWVDCTPVPIVRLTTENLNNLPQNSRVVLCVRDDEGNYHNVSWNDYRDAVAVAQSGEADYYHHYCPEHDDHEWRDEPTGSCYFWDSEVIVTPYYKHPPAAKVPEALSEISDSEHQECYAKGWNACRQSMLAAQEGEK